MNGVNVLDMIVAIDAMNIIVMYAISKYSITLFSPPFLTFSISFGMHFPIPMNDIISMIRLILK